MLLVTRLEDHAELLTSRKSRVEAMVNYQITECIPDYKKDPEDYRCFGQWYIIECTPKDTLVILEDGVSHAFRSNYRE